MKVVVLLAFCVQLLHAAPLGPRFASLRRRGMSVTAATVGLELEFGNLKVCQIKVGHTAEKPVYQAGIDSKLFKSKAKAQGGMDLVLVTRDMVQGHVGTNKVGELEIMTGPFIPTTEEVAKVKTFLTNFWKAVHQTVEAKCETWGVKVMPENVKQQIREAIAADNWDLVNSLGEPYGDGGDAIRAIKVHDVFQKMNELAEGNEELEAVRGARNYNVRQHYFIVEGTSGYSKAQVNFGFQLENYVAAKNHLKLLYGAAPKKAYEKCATGIEAFLNAQPTLTSCKTNKLLQASFCLLFVTGGVFADLWKPQWSDYKNLVPSNQDVSYKNLFATLPKVYIGDPFRLTTCKTELFSFYADLKTRWDELTETMATSFCPTVGKKATCKKVYKSLLEEALDSSKTCNVDRYGDTSTAFGTAPAQDDPKNAKRTFSPAPKPLAHFLIASKPGFVFEDRGSVGKTVSVTVSNYGQTLTFAGMTATDLGWYSKLGTTGNPE